MWVTPAVRDRVTAALPLPLGHPGEPLPEGTKTLVVVGGGTLIDAAKALRVDRRLHVRLIVIPSIWGSGAEISPVAVQNQDGKKTIRVGPELLPDVRVAWPELAQTLSSDLARDACGDVWAHALEGFLSPLANDELRTIGGHLIGDLTKARIGNAPGWFELSAAACALQAHASVGLVHGIAHTLEGPLAGGSPTGRFGHAGLCARMLWPAMRFNLSRSEKLRSIFDEVGLDVETVFAAIAGLYDEAVYDILLPSLVARWRDVLRDPCTRTNVALVRPGDVSFFVEKAFR